MKTRRLFLQYMKYAAAVLLGIGISLSTLYLTNQENLSTVGNYKLVTSKERRAICNYRMVRRFGLTLVQL